VRTLGTTLDKITPPPFDVVSTLKGLDASQRTPRVSILSQYHIPANTLFNPQTGSADALEYLNTPNLPHQAKFNQALIGSKRTLSRLLIVNYSCNQSF